MLQVVLVLGFDGAVQRCGVGFLEVSVGMGVDQSHGLHSRCHLMHTPQLIDECSEPKLLQSKLYKGVHATLISALVEMECEKKNESQKQMMSGDGVQS